MMSAAIIDDNPDDREWLRDLCEQLGITRVTDFEDGPSAIQFLTEKHVNYILLDNILHAERGLSFVPQIRVRSPNAKIVLVTGASTSGVEVICRTFKISCLQKGDLTPETLEAALKEKLE